MPDHCFMCLFTLFCPTSNVLFNKHPGLKTSEWSERGYGVVLSSPLKGERGWLIAGRGIHTAVGIPRYAEVCSAEYPEVYLVACRLLHSSPLAVFLACTPRLGASEGRASARLGQEASRMQWAASVRVARHSFAAGLK